MTSSIFTEKYRKFTKLLTQYRNDALATQSSLAKKLGKPQSFVSKYESCERRIDLIEFLEIAKALQFDPTEFILNLEKKASK